MNSNCLASEVDMQDVAIYARYSSHAQRDTSIEDQVADIEAYCRLNNLRPVKVYADRHLTGTSDKRPQFQQMMKDAAHASWRYVVVWKTDRFARNRYDSATYKYRLKRYGIRVLSAKESIPDGPEGILLESVLEGSAEYYSANLSQNIKRGMHYNALECKVLGAVPYGYQRGPDGRYAIVDAEADVVREIFRKVGDGVPFSEITNDLNGRGIRTKAGGLWSRSSYHVMLKNEAYIGVYKHGDVRVEGGVPAIVDRALFLKVSDHLKTKKNPQGRHRENGDYLLTGKLFCGMCGMPMVGVSGTGKHGELHYYYVCQGRRRHSGCKKENVSRDWIEGLIAEATREHILQPDVCEWIADQVIAYQERELASAQLEALRAERSETQLALNNVMKAIEAGIITATTKRRLQELEGEASRLEKAIYVEEASVTRLDREQVVYFLESFRSGSLSDAAFRRKVIDTFVSAVYLWDDHLRVAFNYSGKKNAVEKELVLEAEALAGAEGSYKPSSAPPMGSQTNPGTTIYFVGPVFVLAMPLPKKRR